MRIDKITFDNYRSFRSLSLDFPQSKMWDLHLLVAPNGVGKTSLLNGIEWCLYGQEDHLSSKDKALPIYNESAYIEAMENHEESLTVMVEIEASHKLDVFTFKREIIFKLPKNTGAKPFQQAPQLMVTRTGAGGTEWHEDPADVRQFINGFVPFEIRKYFFFDGEQMHTFFHDDVAGKKIREDVHQISQIHVVSETKNRLNIIHNSINSQLCKISPELQEKSEEVQKLKDNVTQINNTINELNVQILNANEQIKINNDVIKNIEGSKKDYEFYLEYKNRLAEKEVEKEQLKNELTDLVVRYTKILYFYEANKVVTDFIISEEKKGSLPPDMDKQILELALKVGVCPACNADINDESREFVEKQLERLRLSSGLSNRLSEIKNDIAALASKAKNYKSDKEKLINSIAKCEKDIFSLQEKIRNLPIINEEAGEQAKKTAELAKKSIENFEKQRDEKNRRLGSEEAHLASVSKALEKAQKDYESALDAKGIKDELQKQFIIAGKALRILEEIEEERMAEVRANIEQKTEERFGSLVWKKKSFGKVILNKDYQIDLLSSNGSSCFGSISAAEQALLALAFTLAVHSVSGYESMLVIDTPVAKISDQNRFNYASVLKEVSRDKQIILTFAPNEYSQEIKDAFVETEILPRSMCLSEDENETILKEVI